MSKFLLRILTWLRLVDPHDGNLSLTSIGFILALIKLALLRDVSLTELTAFLAMAGLYSFKRNRPVKAAAPLAPSLDLVKVHADMTAAKDAMAATESKLRLMLDTVAMGRR